MVVSEAKIILENLSSQTDKKREKALYKKFISVLTSIEKKDLSETETMNIEEKLNELELRFNPENRRAYFGKKLSSFVSFLKTNYSFVTNGYYIGLGLLFGMCFGAMIGTMFGVIFGDGTGITFGAALGPGFGMAMGMAIGAVLDAQAKKDGRVI